jgi:hypothetical protein
MMWEIIKHKLSKLGCLFAIALAMIGVTALTKLVLGWFYYDETRRSAISNSVGDYVGKGLLGLAVLGGFLLMGRQIFKELQERRSRPPPIPDPTRRVPPIRCGFRRPPRERSNREKSS